MSSKKCNHRLPVHDHHFTKQRKKQAFACCAYVLHEAIYMRALFCEIQYFSTTSFDCIAEYFRDERKHLSLAFSLQRTCNAGVSGMPRRDMLRTVWTEQCQGKRKHHAAEWNELSLVRRMWQRADMASGWRDRVCYSCKWHAFPRTVSLESACLRISAVFELVQYFDGGKCLYLDLQWQIFGEG